MRKMKEFAIQLLSWSVTESVNSKKRNSVCGGGEKTNDNRSKLMLSTYSEHLVKYAKQFPWNCIHFL